MRLSTSDSTYEKIRKALPEAGAMREAFGSNYIEKPGANGKTETITRIRSPRDVQKLKSLMRKHHELKSERGQEIRARTSYVRMRGPNGVSQVAELAAEKAGANGMVECIRINPRWTMSRSERGTLVRPDGTDTGHTHVGEPYDWQRAGCPGCKDIA